MGTRFTCFPVLACYGKYVNIWFERKSLSSLLIRLLVLDDNIVSNSGHGLRSSLLIRLLVRDDDIVSNSGHGLSFLLQTVQHV